MSTAKRGKRGDLTQVPKPQPPPAPWMTPDDRYCTIVFDRSGTFLTNENHGRGMAVIYAPNFEECEKRSVVVYEALRVLYAQKGENHAE